MQKIARYFEMYTRYILSAVFVFSSFAKIISPRVFVRAMNLYGLSEPWMGGSLLVLAILIELLIAILLNGLIFRYKEAQFSGILLSTLLSSFFFGIVALFNVSGFKKFLWLFRIRFITCW